MKDKIASELVAEGGKSDGFVDCCLSLFPKIWHLRKKLCKAACVGALVGLIVAFSVPATYSVTVVLSPEMNGNKGGNDLAALASSFLGSSFGKGENDALNALLAPEIVASTPFLLELMEVRVAHETAQIDTTLSAYLEMEACPWWNTVLRVPSMMVEGVRSLFSASDKQPVAHVHDKGALYLTKKELSKIRLLRKMIVAEVDKKKSIITLNVMLQDPVITAVLADSLVSQLQKYIISYKVSKAEEDCKYWNKLYQESKDNYYLAQRDYAQYVDANNNIIFQRTLVERERLQNEMSLAYQVYSQVAQQLQMAKAKVQESKPVFTIVEPAVVPLTRTGVSKIVLLVGFAVLAVCCLLIWYLLVLPVYPDIKKNLNKR